VLRYGLLYGPSTSHERLGTTAADIMAARVPLLEGATGLYSWLHVEDAASAAVAALERGAPGIYNVVDDEPAPQPEWLPVLVRPPTAPPELLPRCRGIQCFAIPFSVTGQPAISLPLHWTEDRLPVGVQVIARHRRASYPLPRCRSATTYRTGATCPPG